MLDRFSHFNYEASAQWSDVVPIPQNEGGPRPLAQILYSDEYVQATSYLRAVMASNEMSERVLDLTEHIIMMNPAHYTVWLYRADVLKHISTDPLEELQWLSDLSLKHLKNYQIWGHRQVMMTLLKDMPTTELPFLSRILDKDVKNYHVWSYRQWLVRHFDLWPTYTSWENSSELKFTENLIENDVRNNSAWNHRFFVLFGRDMVDLDYKFDSRNIPDAIWSKEIAFVKDNIAKAPQNASSWNYLNGILQKKGEGYDDIEEFARSFADIDKVDEVRSSHALDLLAEIWEAAGKKVQSEEALLLLAERFDPIRKNYWAWRTRRAREA